MKSGVNLPLSEVIMSRLPETDMATQQSAVEAARSSAGHRQEEERTMWYSTVRGIVLLTFALLAAPLVANAQPAEKVQRIGWLRSNSPPPPEREALLHGLRDMGYVEGQNLVIDIRHGEGKTEAFPALAAELVRLPVTV